MPVMAGQGLYPVQQDTMSDTETLLPVYHKNGTDIMKMFKKTKFCSMKIPFPRFGWISISVSFFSFFFCVFWSIAYHFEEVTATHCSVENFLPSISAAIGNFYPQIYVWNSTVLLQMYPRLKISTMYLHYYCSVIYEKYSNWYYLAWVFHMCELWSLLGLTLVTSTANYPFHAFCFITFLFTSELYMLLTCYLLKFKRKVPSGQLESRTLKWKFKCCVVNIICFLLAGYFFQRHNAYCEPRGWMTVHNPLPNPSFLPAVNVYSLFALSEYGVVVSNILFHQFAIWDFHDKTLTVALTSRGLETEYNPPFKSVQYSFK